VAYAYCPKCDVAYRWYAGRGVRLRFLRCPRCKGELKACSYERALRCREIDEHALYDVWAEWRSGRWEI